MSVDPDEYEAFVKSNREELLTVLQTSDDAFARAAAWAFLDRFSSDPDLETLQTEYETLLRRRNE